MLFYFDVNWKHLWSHWHSVKWWLWQLVEYFSTRMISAETLRRNKVMQRNWNNKVTVVAVLLWFNSCCDRIINMASHLQISIAFTYRRDGVLVGCKYRAVDKTFSQVCGPHSFCNAWSFAILLLICIFIMYQEANTEKIFYGLDDIKRAHDVIIVCSWCPIGFLVAFFLGKICINPFDSMFAIWLLVYYFIFFWHFRWRVKLISCPWMKLAIVIVSVCQMVHHPKCPVKSQTKNRLELFCIFPCC